MKYLRILLFCLISIVSLVSVAQTQKEANLPDAPQVQVDNGLHPLPWRKAFKQKRFYIPMTIALTSVVYDTELTHEGIAHHRCIEGNPDLHIYPSRGELYRYSFAWMGGETVAMYLLNKAGMPWFTYDTGFAVGSYKHFDGGTRWLTECW